MKYFQALQGHIVPCRVFILFFLKGVLFMNEETKVVMFVTNASHYYFLTANLKKLGYESIEHYFHEMLKKINPEMGCYRGNREVRI
jgi:hypothetical protein